MVMDLWSTRTHNQSGLYRVDQSVCSLHVCYLVVSYVMWLLPPALPSVRVPSLGKVCLGQAKMAFDMHSSHNLIASFSKDMHELRLDVWPWLRAHVSPRLLIRKLKSYIPRLITAILSNSSHLSFGTPFILTFFSKMGSSCSQPKGTFSHRNLEHKKTLLPSEPREEAMATRYLMRARLSSMSGM